MVAQLVHVNDDAAATALEVVAGGKLFQVRGFPAGPTGLVGSRECWIIPLKNDRVSIAEEIHVAYGLCGAN